MEQNSRKSDDTLLLPDKHPNLSSKVFTLRQVRSESDGAHVSCPHGHHGEVAKPPLSLQDPSLIQLKQSLRQTIVRKYY